MEKSAIVSRKCLKHWDHALRFYCNMCTPVVKKLIYTNKGEDGNPGIIEMVSNKVEEIFLNIAAEVEEKVKVLVCLIEAIVKENEIVSKSYAKIVSGTETRGATSKLHQPIQTVQEPDIDILDEYNDREKRKNNLIISGMLESLSKDTKQRLDFGTKSVNDLFHTLMVKGRQDE